MRLHDIPMEDDAVREKVAEMRLLGLRATTPEQMERVHQPLEMLFGMAFVASRYDLIRGMMYAFEDISLHAFRKGERRSQWTLTDWGHDWDRLLRLSKEVLSKLEARKEIIPDLVTFVSSDPVYEACLFAFLNKTKDPIPLTVTEVHQRVVQANGGTLTVTRKSLARRYIKDLTKRRIIEKTSYHRSNQGCLYQMTTFGKEVACILEDLHQNQAIERIDDLCGLFNFVTLFHSPAETGSDYVDRTKFEEKLRASHPDDPRFSTSTTVEDLLCAGLYLRIIATAPDDKNAYALRPIWKNQILPKMMNAADERGVSAAPPPPPEPSR